MRVHIGHMMRQVILFGGRIRGIKPGVEADCLFLDAARKFWLYLSRGDGQASVPDDLGRGRKKTQGSEVLQEETSVGVVVALLVLTQ